MSRRILVTGFSGGIGRAVCTILGPPRLQCLRAGHHQPHLLQRAYLRLVHVDHHRFDDRHSAHAGSL